jgi:antitoxin ParD1/3/4
MLQRSSAGRILGDLGNTLGLYFETARNCFKAALKPSNGKFCQSGKIRCMTTVTMNISLPPELKAFADARIAQRGYGSASEYMRDLIRRDEERAAEDRFKALIEEGLNSELLPIDFDLRSHMTQRIEASAQGKARAKDRAKA